MRATSPHCALRSMDFRAGRGVGQGGQLAVTLLKDLVAVPAALGEVSHCIWGGAGSLISPQYLSWERVLGEPAYFL